jgi:hypothetical protein
MLRNAISALKIAVAATAFGGAQAIASSPILFRDVTVIDVEQGIAIAHENVVIDRGKISKVTTSPVSPSGKVRVIDAHRKFLIPGLWNMHVHAGGYDAAKAAFPALIASGVTGLRDMGAPLEDVLRLRRETRSAAVIGPQMIVAGPLVQGPLPFQSPMIMQVRSPADAPDIVRYLRSKHVDFIKVHDAIPEQTYEAVAKAAHDQRLPFVGHVAPTVSVWRAAELHQGSIEHFGGQFAAIMVGSSTHEAQLLQTTRRYYDLSIAALKAGKPPPFDQLRAPFIRTLLTTYSSRKAARLFRLFRRNDVWQCPTLVALPSLWKEHDSALTAEDRAAATDLLAHYRVVLRSMYRAGVPLLAGTDSSYSAAGPLLDDELVEFVAAGLSPAAALRTATINPARFLHRSDFGSIRVGRRADLVLLDRNPLVDIKNLHAVRAVFLAGVLRYEAPNRA